MQSGAKLDYGGTRSRTRVPCIKDLHAEPNHAKAHLIELATPARPTSLARVLQAAKADALGGGHRGPEPRSRGGRE